MGTQSAAYADWKAPPRDGQILLWPEPKQILADTLHNHQILNAAAVMVQNVPLSELRRRQRELLQIDESAPILASGHQVELYHPGVWAKDALVSAAAEKLNGIGLHIAVDTDQPKHLTLRWPGLAIPITDDPRLGTAAWTGLLAAPSRERTREIASAMAEYEWKSQPELFGWIGEWINLLREATPLSAAMTSACDFVDDVIGLKVRRLPASARLSSAPYLALAYHLLALAGETAGHYNSALPDHRRVQNIRTPGRPMPDLTVSPDQCETPFWLDHLTTGERNRLTLSRRGGRWTLDEFEFDAALDGWTAAEKLEVYLRRRSLRLSPRALTLTLYLRLLLADQFIHGIGGGRYDQVVDNLCPRLFNLAPPKFCVTTATLYFPGAENRARPSLPALAHEGHQLHHRLLGAEKMSMVAQIQALPRRSPQRRAMFDAMKKRLIEAAGGEEMRRWETHYAAAKAQIAADQPLWDRELFYAIQPRQRLQWLAAQYREKFWRLETRNWKPDAP